MVNEKDKGMSARWLARSAFALMFAAVAVLIGFARTGRPGHGRHRGDRRVPGGGRCVLVPCPPRAGEVDRARRGDPHPGRHPGAVRPAQPHLGRPGVGRAHGAGGRCRPAGAGPGGRRPGHARPRGPSAQARVPDHEPEVGGRQGREVRAEGEGRGAGGRGGAARGPGHRGRGGAGPAGGRRRRGPARRGRGRRDTGAGGRDRRRARSPVPRDQRRHPQPLRDGPGAGPGKSGRLPRRPHRRRGTADRPRHHRRPDVREQCLVRRLCRGGAKPGLPGRQAGHDAADAARPPERPPGGPAGRPAPAMPRSRVRRPCW